MGILGKVIHCSLKKPFFQGPHKGVWVAEEGRA